MEAGNRMMTLDAEMGALLALAMPILGEMEHAEALDPEALFVIVEPTMVQETPSILAALKLPAPTSGPLVHLVTEPELEALVRVYHGTASILDALHHRPRRDDEVGLVLLHRHGCAVASWALSAGTTRLRNVVRVLSEAMPQLQREVHEVGVAEAAAFLVAGAGASVGDPLLDALLTVRHATTGHSEAPVVLNLTRNELLNLVPSEQSAAWAANFGPLQKGEVHVVVLSDGGALVPVTGGVWVPRLTEEHADALGARALPELVALAGAFWLADAREVSTFLLLDRRAYERLGVLSGVTFPSAGRTSEDGPRVGICSRTQALELVVPIQREDVERYLALPLNAGCVHVLVLAEDGSTICRTALIARSATRGVCS
jgi:hypothetical protein